jgi:SAM-dependent methyltransferase
MARHLTPDEFERFQDQIYKIAGIHYPVANRLPPRLQFDAVLVRNVLIYFAQTGREKVLDHACHSMRPGGLLLIGESESLLNVKYGLQYMKSSIFTKPLTGFNAPKQAVAPGQAKI